MSRGGPRPEPERGSVTAETAVVLPVLLLVLGMATWALACLSGQLRCTDAAAVGARAAARGDSPSAVVVAARSVAPPGAQVQVSQDGDRVRVVVSASVRPAGGALRGLGAMAVEGTATALREDVGAVPTAP